MEAKSNGIEARAVPTNFNEKNFNLQNTKVLYFTCLFINYHYIIDSCKYLLLSDKISSKTKTLPFNATNQKLREVLY